ncbi:MAG: hypothetical protein N2255_06710, partial [Kiritimatiellae bacterium]|nr:hypothetical protein [Kiritimatiellia bacterium]
MKISRSNVKQMLLVAVLLAARGEVGAESRFSVKPRAVKTAEGVVIRFALTAPTDVEVAVLDKDGTVVRHLAAGMLGKNAPHPFRKDSLEQELVWDGRADDGTMIAGDNTRGPFRIRIAAGMSVEFAGTAFGSEAKANILMNVQGLGVGPDGRLYVLSERWTRAWWRGTAIHVFKRTGEYERTIKPFPASLPAERLGHLTALRDERGRAVPVIYRVLAMTYYPYEDIEQHMAVTPDGNLHFFVIRAAYYKDRENEKWLASLGPDGGLAYSAYTGGEIRGESAHGDVYLAPSSDGRAVFATGIHRGQGEGGDGRPNLPVVFKIELPGRNEVSVFFGDPKQAGADKGHLGDARGIATDGRNRLFVGDRANNRVL